MADRAIDVYLNDHLAGASLGSDLAAQIRDREEGSARGELMARLAAEIEEDRQTLVELMEAMDVSQNPVKQVGGWLAEKASRVKFSGAMSGEPDQSAFMALESLRLGVAGKKCLWLALKQVELDYEQLRAVDLDRLIERATVQEHELERERMAASAAILAADRQSAELKPAS